ncbi:hypothetical protein HDU77_002496 [Chytriomyces hyalinus]|nr:hypothetical protein HDU77_002496 [Chytriomyces hyalinus]
MDPLTSMDAFESSKPAPRQISITCSPAFETMPPEILDRVVQFVDADSILPLCHSMPYYKYISTAMFDYARRFPNECYTPYELWPNMYLPMILTPESNIIDFPVKHVHAAAVYSRIISKHGGEINVPCSKNVLNYLGALPDAVSVNPGDTSSGSGWAEFLRGLADGKKQIQTCIVDIDSGFGYWPAVATQLKRLQIQSLYWMDVPSLPVEIQNALPFISGLSYLEMTIQTELQENILSRCLNLKEIAFTRLLGLEDAVEQVRCMLQHSKGSRIQKVYCDKPVFMTYGWELEAMETISSEFLKYGFHKESIDGDDRACFVYRQS